MAAIPWSAVAWAGEAVPKIEEIDLSSPKAFYTLVALVLAMLVKTLLDYRESRGLRSGQDDISKTLARSHDDLVKKHDALDNALKTSTIAWQKEHLENVQRLTDITKESERTADTLKVIQQEQFAARERVHAFSGDVHAASTSIAVMRERHEAVNNRLERMERLLERLDRRLSKDD